MTFDDEDELVARLVRAGRADGPSNRALQAAPVAIGALLAATAANAAFTQVGGAAALQAGKAVLSPLLLVKWVAVGTVVGGSLMALSQVPQLFERTEPAKLAAAPGAPALVSAAPRAQAVVATSPPQVEPEPAPVDSAISSAATPRRPDVAREVAQLDAARQALLGGNADEALQLLAALERLPGRALAPEATVLRARALLAQGKLAEARGVSARFCTSAPTSPQCPVLQALVANSVIQPAPSRL
jgi:TolA-binding protein